MEKYKISIMIPVYNVEQYIDEAMNSILNQTIGFQNLQILFVDDCSTDRSGKIIDSYAEKYSNVFVIHLSQNTGAAGVPRNIALKEATAPYVIFWDPDDYYINTACEFLYNRAQETDAEIIGGDHKAIDENGNVLYEKWPEVEKFQNLVFYLPNDLSNAVKYRGSVATKIYKRSFLLENEIKFPDHIPGQDLVFYCRCLISAKQVKYYSEPIYVYRIRDKKNPSISHIKTESYFYGISECYSLCFEIFKSVQRLDCFNVLIYGVLDDYVAKMIDSHKINKDQLTDILKKWYWLFSYVFENRIEHLNVYSDIIMQFVINGDFEMAAHIIATLKPIRSYLNEVLDANTWLKKQIQNYKKNEQEKSKVITELRDWIKELEKAKLYFEKQIKNKDNAITELQNWTKELEVGKNYLETQWNNAKNENEKIAIHCSEIENQCDELNNINSKLKYKLNVLLNDIGVQKIIKKKKYDI